MGRSAKKEKLAAVAKGCVTCGQRYVDRWEPPEVLGQCQACKSGHAKMDAELAQYPRDCCFLNARPVTTKAERDRMSLGGPPDMVWYICAPVTNPSEGCHRTFPFVSPARAPWVWGMGAEPTEQEKKREHSNRSRLGGR